MDNKCGCQERTGQIIVRALTNGADNVLVPVNANRVRLEIYFTATGGGVAGNLPVNNRPLTSAQDGLLIGSSGTPLILDVETHGDIVQSQWHGWGLAASLTVGIIEIVKA